MKETELSLILEEARSEITSSQKLKELGTHDTALVRKAVVENPNTSMETLFKLGAEFPHQFLANPILDLLLLEDSNFMQKIPIPTLLKIIPLEEVPAYFLSWVSEQNNPSLLLAAINNQNISLEILNKLATHKVEAVAQAARLHINYCPHLKRRQQEKQIEQSIDRAELSNSHLELTLLALLREFIPDILKQKLSRDRTSNRKFYRPEIFDINNNRPNKWTIQHQLSCYKLRVRDKYKHENWFDLSMRAEAAEDPDTPIKKLQEFAQDSNKSIRCHVAKNPNLPLELRRKLAVDTQKTVRATVAKSRYTPTIILELLAEPQYGVRNEIAQNPNTPKSILIQLAKNKHISVSRRLAGNPNTPEYILQQLITIEDRQVKYQLASNPSLPIQISKQLAKIQCYKIRCKLVNNINTPAEVLLNIISKNKTLKEPNINQIISFHPNATETVLCKLTEYCFPMTLPFILTHPNCTLKVKKFVFNAWANDYDFFNTSSFGRLAVFFSPDATSSVLEANANSIFWLERYAIAINPNTPQNIKQLLKQDSNIIVKNAANNN